MTASDAGVECGGQPGKASSGALTAEGRARCGIRLTAHVDDASAAPRRAAAQLVDGDLRICASGIPAGPRPEPPPDTRHASSHAGEAKHGFATSRSSRHEEDRRSIRMRLPATRRTARRGRRERAGTCRHRTRTRASRRDDRPAGRGKRTLAQKRRGLRQLERARRRPGDLRVAREVRRRGRQVAVIIRTKVSFVMSGGRS